MADNQDISYNKAKLLTKAYYKLLRDVASDHPHDMEQQDRIMQQENEPRLSWQTLLQTDVQQVAITQQAQGSMIPQTVEFQKLHLHNYLY